MFQCIIQQRNGWIHAPNPETRDVFPDIRLQLNEQLRCLDTRVETQVALVQELQDFFRKRGEVELDYSKGLEKLSKSLQIRHKEQKQKREQWPLFSSYACWQQLINQTKSLSKDHATLAEIYSTHLIVRLQTVIEDIQRIYKKCREIAYETHEEILRVLQELHTTMKTYHSYQTEAKAAETKLRTAEQQRLKLQQTNAKEKLEKSKKYKLIEKEVLKRKNKYTDARLKALKAKNEYSLCLEASNTTIHKYFVEDLSDLIDCMDLGFHCVISRALMMHVTADQGRCRALSNNAESLSHIVHSMDSRADKQKFLEQHHGAFMIPKRLEFQAGLNQTQPVDDVLPIFQTMEPELQKALHLEMEARLQHLEQRVCNLRTESEEIWKTLETAETNLLEILNTKDYDSSCYFIDPSIQSTKSDLTLQKQKANKQEIEEFYITKIREFILGTSRISRLDAKAEFLRGQLAQDNPGPSHPVAKAKQPKRKRIGRMNMIGQPKLFGGSLEEYLEATNEEIPLIIRSCIRVINLYGLHHQGIFRVSGSQVEISNFREGFEKGEDPLADTTDASDINSVAGVFKLYLRELREPLFPIIYFDHFVSLAQLESKHEIVLGIRKFLQSLPRSVVIVIRYLFAFLNHLSEFADENMMDAYNLAICFGPTLMPAPDDKDQVQYQNQVNELIKNMIVYHEDLFPKDMGGITYEKYISQDFIDIDVGDSPTTEQEDPDSEVYPSEDESDTMEATVQFDFIARSNRELSLRKGDSVVLRKQVSNDWWVGTVHGKDGLIPDKYISLKIKDEDRDRSSENMKSSSSEESVRKRRPSGTVNIPSQLSVCKTDAFNPPQSNLPAPQKKKQAQPQEVITTTTVINAPLYDSVDTVSKKKYSFHDEPHSFENSMEFLEDFNHFQFEGGTGNNGRSNKPSEPIYAEPSKAPPSQTDEMQPNQLQQGGGGGDEGKVNFDEYDGVQIRKSASSTNEAEKSKSVQDVLIRHSDSEVVKQLSLARNAKAIDADEKEDKVEMRSARKYHSKSLSLSENRILSSALGQGLSLATTNSSSQVFHQNRELWEKRSESGNLNQDSLIAASRILSRNRIAPDLVMDLPSMENKSDNSNSSSSLSLSSQEEDKVTVEQKPEKPIEKGSSSADESVADRFVDQNQCTLKKNEKFVLDTKNSENIMTEVLHISEGSRSSSLDKKGDNKSPIPTRNTQKFVSQFADLGINLTGGSQPSSLSSTASTDSGGSLSSFKPQVKVKPQILKKPLVLPPTTPEMGRRNQE